MQLTLLPTEISPRIIIGPDTGRLRQLDSLNPRKVKEQLLPSAYWVWLKGGEVASIIRQNYRLIIKTNTNSMVLARWHPSSNQIDYTDPALKLIDSIVGLGGQDVSPWGRQCTMIMSFQESHPGFLLDNNIKTWEELFFDSVNIIEAWEEVSEQKGGPRTIGSNCSPFGILGNNAQSVLQPHLKTFQLSPELWNHLSFQQIMQRRKQTPWGSNQSAALLGQTLANQLRHSNNITNIQLDNQGFTLELPTQLNNTSAYYYAKIWKEISQAAQHLINQVHSTLYPIPLSQIAQQLNNWKTNLTLTNQQDYLNLFQLRETVTTQHDPAVQALHALATVGAIKPGLGFIITITKGSSQTGDQNKSLITLSFVPELNMPAGPIEALGIRLERPSDKLNQHYTSLIDAQQQQVAQTLFKDRLQEL